MMFNFCKSKVKYLYNYIKFIIQTKFQTSKYVLKGKCNQCGYCCRNIVFVIGKKYVSTQKEFEDLKKFKKAYNHFFISGKKDDGTLLFTCKSLGTNNKCKDYKFRSIYCRQYPLIKSEFFSNGGVLLDNCGYKIELKKNFKDFLN